MNESYAAEAVIVLTTFPDLETARQIGTNLIEAQVAACVNLLGGCESIYRWQGAIETAREIPALIKSTRGSYAKLEAMIQGAHPYEVPEILCIPVGGGAETYLQWLIQNVPSQNPVAIEIAK
jgi:periplasmic divalent cation tolerance protein